MAAVKARGRATTLRQVTPGMLICLPMVGFGIGWKVGGWVATFDDFGCTEHRIREADERLNEKELWSGTTVAVMEDVVFDVDWQSARAINHQQLKSGMLALVNDEWTIALASEGGSVDLYALSDMTKQYALPVDVLTFDHWRLIGPNPDDPALYQFQRMPVDFISG